MERLSHACDLPRQTKSKKFTLSLVLVVFVTLVAAGAALAQTTTWTGAGFNDAWSDPANWDSGVPQNGWTVFMSGGGQSVMNIPGLYLGMLDMTGWGGMFSLTSPLNVSGPAYLHGNVQMFGRPLGANTVMIYDFVNTGGGGITTSNDLRIYGDLMGGGILSIGGNLEGSSGGSLVGTFNIDIMAGSADLSGLSTVDLLGGAINLAGGSLLVPSGATLGDVSMMGSGSIGTGGGSASITGVLSVASGSIDIQSANLVVTGPVFVNSGAALYNDTGTNRMYDFNGGVSINSGTFRVMAGGCELNFAAGAIVDVLGSGTFMIAGGTPPNRITLRQDGTAGGTQWNLNHQPTATVNIMWADIQDGAATPSVVVYDCVDQGNNTGFIFAADIDVAPASFAFGAVPISTTATDTLVVYNLGSQVLSVGGISNNLSQYSASPTIFTVAGYDSQKVAVEFTPTAPVIYLDSLWIASDDPDEPLVVVPLSGSGAAADLSISIFSSPPEVRLEGDEVSVSFTIENTGDLSSGPFRNSLRISPDNVITTGDLWLDSVYVGDIAATMDTTINLTVNLPKPAPRGDVYLGVIADDLDWVLELNENNNTAWNAFTYHVPSVNSVRDVPSDQGGVVYLSWFRSPLDDIAEGGLITEYSLWRAIDAGAAGAMLKAGAIEFAVGVDAGDPAGDTAVIRIERAAARTWFWQLINTEPAYLLEAYGSDVPTLFDSTGAGFEYHYFQVIAHTSDRLVFYTAAPDSGYSVDDLAPAAPQNLAGEQTEPEALELTWDPNTEADLSHYGVYRGTTADFVPGPSNRIGEPTDPALTDGEWRWDGGYYYKVTAIDVHDNESPYAWFGPGGVTGVEKTGPPKANYLAQSRPNPFGTTTRVAFGLAEDAQVSIRIYDVAGRLVRTLVDERRAADDYSVEWNGRDDAGRVVAGGVYFYRITAGTFVQTRKMTLLR